MGSVIQFPHSENVFSPEQVDFLQVCHSVLCEEDYLDLLEAIESVEAYSKADTDIQELVVAYTDIF